MLLSGFDERFRNLQYHVVLTERCNLNCGYWGGTRHVEGIPFDVAYDVDELANFLAHDLEAIIGFYGGEPLLAVDKRARRLMALILTRSTPLTSTDSTPFSLASMMAGRSLMRIGEKASTTQSWTIAGR